VKVDLREFLSAYVAEVDEQLESAIASLLEIEQHARAGTPHPRAMRDLFRVLHTIKGLSAMVDVEPLVDLAHRLEAIVRQADRSGGWLETKAIDAVLAGVRAIELGVKELAEGKPLTAAPKALYEALDSLEPAEQKLGSLDHGQLDLDETIVSKLAPFELASLVHAADDGRRAVRADFSPSPEKAARGLSINSVRERVAAVAEIVKVVPLAVSPSKDAPGGLSFALLLRAAAPDEEIAAAIGIAPAAVRPLVGGLVAKPAASLAPEPDDDELAVRSRRNVVRVDVARLDDAMEHLSTLIVTRSRLAQSIRRLGLAGVNTRELDEIMRDNARQLRDLRAAILRVRMIPVAEVLERIPLIVRSLRRASDKAVRVEIDAGDTEIDKGVAERLFPALVHIVRNAFDHAIESPARRRELGKPDEATLYISSRSPSNARVELTIRDDGAGVDRAAVARRVGREIASDDALLDAICAPGLSTRDEATRTSGRGMGMDIVKRVVVDQLGGELTMKTELGVGTTFILRVPLTISIIEAFTLDCCARRFVVPVSMVEEIIELERVRVHRGPHAAHDSSVRAGLIERRGEALPLLDLAASLAMPARETPALQALVVRRGASAMAFALDRVVGQQEAVVRPLVDPLVTVAGVSGATDLGDGKPTLVLDLFSLGARLLSAKERAA
jgi:two-component system chemotaxis sensor kinase CheA